jgi:serine/threonine protein kinase/Flp pilus assembly protein TadD
MSKSVWEKYEEIFPLVADLPVNERKARLTELCAGDDILRREILALLNADEKAAGFIESPVALPDSLSKVFLAVQTENPATDVPEDRQFGAYRVVRKIGAGGMGTVYLAERADGAFNKKVAIKLVNKDADTDFNLRRFRHERQILAALEHPNIARLLDGGTTKDGFPFLVMEYVEGKTLFDFCRSRDLDLRERLNLFRQICAAVQYAHERQIIHRDIKPGNILVTEKGAVKLLDFGIAKILDADLIGESIGQTETMMRQMTPEFASPEQIKGEAITPASDVYSLGVCLYELLTGERPYKFPSRAPHEIARVICEQKIQSPKININNQSADDLKFIILKSLQKKPSERYLSVSEFDRDIERFLTGLPVLTESKRLRIFEKTALDLGDASVSLAVAPFQILPSGNPETGSGNFSDDFLGFGMADALTTKLSAIRQLALRPTSSIIRLAADNKNALKLGKELGVDYVLEGHILRFGKQIRVSIQLLETKNDRVLWAGQFDEADADIFRLQDSISERVAESLVPQLTTEEQEVLRRHGTTNAAAFEAYLRGRVSYHTYTLDGIIAAENHFKQAIAHDPDFALAHSGLADFYNWLSVAGLTTPGEGFTKAKESARRAIKLDSQLSEAHASLAFALWAFDWDFSEAERLFQKSIQLNSNNVKAHEWFAYLLSSTERHNEALEEMRRAERLDPNSPSVAAMFAFCLFNARRYEEGLEKTRQALGLDPNYYLALQGLGWVCPPLGKYDEAIAGCRRAVEISDGMSINKFSLALALIAAGEQGEAREIAVELEERHLTNQAPAYYPALIYANLNEPETAFRWLDKAIDERGYWTLWMRVEPRFDCLRGLSRFDETVEKIKPLQSAKTTDNLEFRPTYKIQMFGKFKTRTTFGAAAALICVVIVVAAAFNVGFWAKDDTPRKIMFHKKHNSTNRTPAIVESSGERSEEPLTDDAVAKELYQAGKQQLEPRTLDGVNRAIKLFTEAAKRDSNFALAFSGLADAHIILADKDDKAAATAYRTAEEYALKALALDPDLAEARTSLAMTTYKNTGNFAAAEKHFLRAIEINPSLSRAHHWYSQLLRASGRNEEGLREITIAAELEPRSAVIHYNVGIANLDLKRYQEAIACFDKAIEFDGNFLNSYLTKSIAQQMLGDYKAALETYRIGRIYSGKDENEAIWILMQAQAHAADGRRDESLALLNRLLRNPARREETAKLTFDIALVYNLLGDADAACQWLEKIELKKVKTPDAFGTDPRFANLRGNPRYERLIEKLRNLKNASKK